MSISIHHKSEHFIFHQMIKGNPLVMLTTEPKMVNKSLFEHMMDFWCLFLDPPLPHTTHCIGVR